MGSATGLVNEIGKVPGATNFTNGKKTPNVLWDSMPGIERQSAILFKNYRKLANYSFLSSATRFSRNDYNHDPVL
jgi:hypothetical protein